MITIVVGAWLGALVVSRLARRRERRARAWLRSEVPAKVAYARLREQIDRQAMDDNR
jgi:hypothetical protein